MTYWTASIVAVSLASVSSVASAQNCDTMPAGPARTDCYIGLSHVYRGQSDLAAGNARVQSDAARLQQATGTRRPSTTPLAPNKVCISMRLGCSRRPEEGSQETIVAPHDPNQRHRPTVVNDGAWQNRVSTTTWSGPAFSSQHWLDGVYRVHRLVTSRPLTTVCRHVSSLSRRPSARSRNAGHRPRPRRT